MIKPMYYSNSLSKREREGFLVRMEDKIRKLESDLAAVLARAEKAEKERDIWKARFEALVKIQSGCNCCKFPYCPPGTDCFTMIDPPKLLLSNVRKICRERILAWADAAVERGLVERNDRGQYRVKEDGNE